MIGSTLVLDLSLVSGVTIDLVVDGLKTTIGKVDIVVADENLSRNFKRKIKYLSFSTGRNYFQIGPRMYGSLNIQAILNEHISIRKCVSVSHFLF